MYDVKPRAFEFFDIELRGHGLKLLRNSSDEESNVIKYRVWIEPTFDSSTMTTVEKAAYSKISHDYTD